ncbi:MULTISPECIES: CHAT domain-containing protein [unclassified Microcoleus]|uniref:CHAT domain-containing protein n=1 Tax=unclassified Microcoleus TaxID=2642155 RepID=UPI002FCFFA9A
MNLTFWVGGRLGLAVGASILLASPAAPNPKTFQSFGDWCANKQNLTPEARHTVEVLLSKAKTQECDRAQKTLANLTELSLKSNQIVSLEPLVNLTNLRIIQLNDNQVVNLEPLANLTNLTHLYLIRNQIVDLKQLSRLTNLQTLNLSGNKTTDLQPLSELRNLKKLTLNLNQISDVKPLSGLTNLTELFLESNRIADAAPLSKLTNLVSFSIASNQIGDVSPLSRMTNLIFLYLGNNKIEELKPLSGLSNIQLLSSESNQILDIKPLTRLTNLRSLNLSQNQIADVKSLAGLTNLRDLDLSKNQIADVTPLSGLTNLKSLDLRGNKIPDGEADRLLEKNQQLLNQQTDESERLIQEARRLFTQGTAESYRAALQKFDAARLLYQRLGKSEEEGDILNQMGLIANRLGERQQALDYYKESVSISQILAARPGAAITLNNIGSVYYALGEKQQALDYYNQVLSLIREMSDRPGAAINLNNLLNIPANSDTSLGDRPGQPIPLSNILNISPNTRALEGDRTVEATTLNNIGLAYKDLGEKQKAKEHFDRALTLFRAMGDRGGEATTLNNIGLVYSDLGENQKALEYYNQSLPLRQVTGDRRQEAVTLNNIGNVYSALGEKQKALEYHNQSLSLSRAVGNPSLEALTFYNIAFAKRDLGNFTEALTNIEASIKIIENLRTKIASPELRTSYFATVQDYYEFYIDLLMQLHKTNPKSGYDTKALEASERSRARSLLELLKESNSNIREGVAPELLQQEQRLQQQLDTIEQRRIQLVSSPSPNQAQVAEIDKQRLVLLQEYQQNQTQIRSASPRYAALTQPQPLTLAQIQKQILDENTILLQYSLGEDRSYLWVVTSKELTSYELPKRADIETAAKNFRDTTTDARSRNIPQRVAETSTALSQLILQPAAAQLGQKRLLIVPDGVLHYTPFAALTMPQKTGENANLPLIAQHEIITLPSVSTLAILRQNYADRKPPDRTLAILADPVFSPTDERIKGQITPATTEKLESKNLGLNRSLRSSSMAWPPKRLPFTRDEAKIIFALLPTASGVESFDFAASRATATDRNLANYQIVHFATHGMANSENPELSGILMSMVDDKGNPVNGFLRLTDIFYLKLAANLVVLSACQTGMGQNIKGEGMVGLTRGFMYAGAQRVAVSLWSVDDEGTALLMQKFYRKMLQEKLAPAAALRAAQMEMMQDKKWQSPYYWAAFTLQGEWR